MLKQTLLSLMICAVTLLAIFQPAHAQISEFKITASDAEVSDFFGNSVSISGDYAIVGAIADDDDGLESGSAYIFKRSGTSWAQEAKLLASDGSSGDEHGYSVSISDGYTIVGARNDDDKGIFSGSAYLYGFCGPFITGIIDVPHDQGGWVTLNWDASNVSSGIYLYRLQADDFVQTKKMLLLK